MDEKEECNEKKRKKKVRARKKALTFPARDKMIKSPPVFKTAKEDIR